MRNTAPRTIELSKTLLNLVDTAAKDMGDLSRSAAVRVLLVEALKTRGYKIPIGNAAFFQR